MFPESIWSYGHSNHQITSLATVATLATLIGAYLYYRKKTPNIPKNWTPVTKVTQLFVYPLKSGRRREVQSMYCTDLGPTFTENNVELKDRSFIVYGEGNNEFKVAKTYPKLLLIQVAVNNNGDLVFTAPEQNPLIMKFPNPENKPVIITMDNKAPAETLDCGDAAATWLSQYILNKPSGIRLGYYRSQFKRNIKSQYPEYVGVYNNMRLQSAGIYTNLTSYHLINQRSIDALNKSLEEPTSANNFRPNIIVESENLEAYSEENWDWIKIGDVVLRLIRPCTRCAMTTVHPERAVYSKQREPLKSLERLNNPKQPAYLKLEGKRGVMGIQIELWKAGQIHVGDEVFIA